jgi:hypothetical protein
MGLPGAFRPRSAFGSCRSRLPGLASVGSFQRIALFAQLVDCHVGALSRVLLRPGETALREPGIEATRLGVQGLRQGGRPVKYG